MRREHYQKEDWSGQMTVYRDGNLSDVTLYRFHLRRHLPSNPDDLCVVFANKPFLADQQARYAGAAVNPGWFFALSRSASVSEMASRLQLQNGIRLTDVPGILEYCLKSGEERVLIACKASLQKILNLLWLPSLRDAIQSRFERVTGWRYADAGTILLALADEEFSGNPLTDVIGRYAYDHSYEGVRFPSARALELGGEGGMFPGAPLRDRLEYGAIGEESFEFDDLLYEINRCAANLVVFRGAYLVHCIRQFRFEFADGCTTEWKHNVRHGSPIARIQGVATEVGGISETETREMCSGAWGRLRQHFADHGWEWGPMKFIGLRLHSST